MTRATDINEYLSCVLHLCVPSSLDTNRWRSLVVCVFNIKFRTFVVSLFICSCLFTQHLSLLKFIIVIFKKELTIPIIITQNRPHFDPMYLPSCYNVSKDRSSVSVPWFTPWQGNWSRSKPRDHWPTRRIRNICKRNC